MADPRPRAFVCGHPVAHSRSPLIHGFWLREAKIDGDYVAVDRSTEAFPAFLGGAAAADYVGGNITIPHKETAFRLIARRDSAAEIIGAVNTVWLEQGELVGGNTDWIGFSANLDDFAPHWRKGRTTVVLGAGGAARGVIHAVLQSGFTAVRVVNRTVARARELADRFGPGVSAHSWHELPELLMDADLLVNTTSLGMAGEALGAPDLGRLPPKALVTDIVYTPLKTPLLAAAEARGLATVDGLGMLLHQAAPGFERWFGVRPAISLHLRHLIEADLVRAA